MTHESDSNKPSSPEGEADISERIAALHAAGETDVTMKRSRIHTAPWDDLTWWEKRQRFQFEMRRANPRFRKGELRDLIIQKDGLVEPYPVRNQYAIGVHTQDGIGYVVVPKARFYLTRDLKKGPIAIHFESNPEAIWEQSPKGLTMVHLRPLVGGTLRAAIEKGNKDPPMLPALGKWFFLGLIVVGAVGTIAWLWYRGVI